ncbi:hypothetical protein [Vibrio sp. YIC-376]|uniref:hypothetical protein n=1 Tax=Vibrio sp. YIC-376 TaxID=3136162 RepID=UPI00402AB01F
MTLNDYLQSLNDLVLFQNVETKGSFKYHLHWYAIRHPKHRRYFYISGFVSMFALLVTYSGASTPEFGKSISTLLLFIASMSSLFSFKRSWSGYYLAEQNLIALKDIYDEALLRARLIEPEDEDKALNIAIESTMRFMTATNEVINNETVGYFDALNPPNTPLNKWFSDTFKKDS